jgi:pimeloyl-ACP methyl ester carboxylesterase
MDAVDCAYSIEGKGPPILFVHGVGGSRQVWTGVIVRLKSEFTCISYDLRGHGESPSAPAWRSMSGLAPVATQCGWTPRGLTS